MAASGLSCGTQDLCCGKRGLLFVAVRNRLLIAGASFVAEHGP